jgi:hypothetical protein
MMAWSTIVSYTAWKTLELTHQHGREIESGIVDGLPPCLDNIMKHILLIDCGGTKGRQH